VAIILSRPQDSFLQGKNANNLTVLDPIPCDRRRDRANIINPIMYPKQPSLQVLLYQNVAEKQEPVSYLAESRSHPALNQDANDDQPENSVLDGVDRIVTSMQV